MASLLPVSSEIWKWKCDVILTYWLGKYTENTSMIWYSVVSTNNKRNDMTRKSDTVLAYILHYYHPSQHKYEYCLCCAELLCRRLNLYQSNGALISINTLTLRQRYCPTETGYICDITGRWKLLYHFWHNIIFRQYRLCKEHTSVRGWCFIFSKRIKSK